jgi:hypothetical protein
VRLDQLPEFGLRDSQSVGPRTAVPAYTQRVARRNAKSVSGADFFGWRDGLRMQFCPSGAKAPGSFYRLWHG